MLRLKLSLARSTQDVGADQALYTDTELKPEQKVCLTNILYYNMNKNTRGKNVFLFLSYVEWLWQIIVEDWPQAEAWGIYK